MIEDDDDEDDEDDEFYGEDEAPCWCGEEDEPSPCWGCRYAREP